jgi:UDP-N-acetylmuramate: L-alanyl-gamma-D-glutamyl-meso-diaminopimelate ligase
MKKIHILAICGTFMGGIAQLARALGYRVSGQDANVYPPMSDQLTAAGITLHEGWEAAAIPHDVDWVVIGNALSRGNPAVEAVLDRGLRYTSGPQWLAEEMLASRWVIAVAGTHGKTTTSSMVAKILEAAGLEPGFLIGGVPADFALSARLGRDPFFVVEADEYDTAFFDKRSKFVHYHPRTLIMNNLEFDHADIFGDLAAIQRQFHHLVRTVPASGKIILPSQDEALQQVVAMGCWSEREVIGSGGWQAIDVAPDGSRATIRYAGRDLGVLDWGLLGAHNIHNALAAIAASRHTGVAPRVAIAALNQFQGVKRRLELRGTAAGVTIYDDFAHHPTAIATTLAGLRARVGKQRIFAILEPRSNTMRMGVHNDLLLPSLAAADRIFLYTPANLGWQPQQLAQSEMAVMSSDLTQLIDQIVREARSGDHLLVMSNGGFGGIHQRLLGALASRHE